MGLATDVGIIFDGDSVGYFDGTMIGPTDSVDDIKYDGSLLGRSLGIFEGDDEGKNVREFEVFLKEIRSGSLRLNRKVPYPTRGDMTVCLID